VSEVLEHKRPLSITMIRNIYETLKIPAEVLIQEPAGKWVKKSRGGPEKRMRATRARSSAAKTSTSNSR